MDCLQEREGERESQSVAPYNVHDNKEGSDGYATYRDLLPVCGDGAQDARHARRAIEAAAVFVIVVNRAVGVGRRVGRAHIVGTELGESASARWLATSIL